MELDNGLVRAQVLPSLGGRVWSMVDLASGRELLHQNPRLRWANFGLTDAWFAGGIEWNLGSTGHTTMSNLPMHAARLDTPLGTVLRLWEWERTRDLVLQIDLWLRGARLMASTRVINPDPEPKPLYYWTNIAVPETPDTRVLVPATTAWRTDYGGRLERVSVPFPDGPADVSVPSASRYAADYFFDVGDHPGRVVTAVEPDGRGFGQTSTDALRGRKLFLWGSGPGGNRWQDWLGAPGNRYLEIQAGVCTTQLEHDELGANATISWTEAFGAIELDPGRTTAEYAVASSSARNAVLEQSPPERLEADHAYWLAQVADRAPEEVLHTGSGWGRVELALRGDAAPKGLTFLQVDDDSAPLRRLVENDDAAGLATFSPDLPTLPPVSERWVDRFTEISRSAPGWWVHYALGTARHVREDAEGARTAYEKSLEIHPTAWAMRGLALLTDDADTRAKLYAEATTLAPEDRRLATERLLDLARSGRHREVVEVIGSLIPAVREAGRTRMMLANALTDLGEHDAALEVLADIEVPDLAEGDRTLSDLWERLRPEVPVPAHLDFRMSGEVPEVIEGNGS
ncbi:hypothetical protein N802_02280 [Knoellia sinensis KCTC 19936]|uniref:DUF5107 domain-containing protein n=1 Tax=Knoellia sinensis KCTC 19936 TaxID=1385520 RepID=A0A0A0JFM9_9MICO|nr:hypothetical protein N802_02280 [Knoellia sinensis KCTC 19936]